MADSESGAGHPAACAVTWWLPIVGGMAISQPEPDSGRERLWRIIFLSDTRAGHVFDVVLLWLVCLST